ncbi:aminotransferase class I/II-fold pyridoxal phosphate-dependent enzyme [Mangrovibacterium lignilyticum]|uniref:aminotransferase class I/II-fold pyridoxal phosphate-dependent enzyme n=1 Tax=Mangrovibacterium lignilyticum TaxID=2668052 RepID=UPI0013D602F3|nr:8-amino-7-oxononanoate synthase [Mangrovibacterium lignilyticum]
MKQNYIDRLTALEKQSNLRKIPQAVPQGQVNLSSNDYLGIAADLRLKTEFLESQNLAELNFTAASSRLLTGNCSEYDRLEKLIAQAYQRESCLVFNSGYHANIGILPALAGSRDLIIADKLVHASIIDGLQLSKAEIRRYRHQHYDHLESLLQKYRDDYEQVFIVTESIFSMDGDLANLPTLVRLKKQYKAFLYVDEAHALGVSGTQGLGLSEHDDLMQDIDFIVGTFGKALASVGAFVVCDTVFKNYLINTSRSFIFTTALPSINLAWTVFIFEKMLKMTERRKQLEQLCIDFSECLNIPYQSHIIPVIIGGNNEAVRVAERLREEGFYILPIRHPTVPEGTARLRISLYAGLQIGELNKLINQLTAHDAKMD